MKTGSHGERCLGREDDGGSGGRSHVEEARSPADEERGQRARLTRRRFIVQGGSALVALSLGAAACSDGAQPTGPDDGDDEPSDPTGSVIVVGAGLAGMVAAYELGRAGHEVTVLEARDEAGGRARTFRDPFDDGLLAEAGPARIPPDHDLTLAYIDHFGLETSPFYPTEGDYIVQLSSGEIVTETPEEHVGQRLGGRQSWVKIPGGTDLLPRAFAEALDDRIRYGSPVTRIVRDDPGATVTYEAGSSSGTLSADHVLVTVPLPVMDRIAFEPALSGGKRAAMSDLGYVDVTRVYVQYARRVWEEDGLNGWGLTAFPEELWHPTWNQEGPRGLLMSYMFQSKAREIAAMDPGEIVPTFISHFDELLPGTAEVAEKGHVISWKDEPWIGGAFAAHDPVFSENPELASPEGDIHFAGEHASGYRGWMQGAFQSGLRAAREISDAVSPVSGSSPLAVATDRRSALRTLFAAGGSRRAGIAGAPTGWI